MTFGEMPVLLNLLKLFGNPLLCSWSCQLKYTESDLQHVLSFVLGSSCHSPQSKPSDRTETMTFPEPSSPSVFMHRARYL